MGEQLANPDDFLSGDKVRIRSGLYAGSRGIIQDGSNEQLEIQLDEGDIVHVTLDEVTNYSLAARRAWKAMPKRAGRPQLSSPRKKMVSIRLDVDVWDRLGEAVELGLVPGKEQAVNAWLRQHLDLLFKSDSHFDITDE